MTAATRILVRRIHLWLGLSVGTLFVVLGITGSALVFYVEIDDLLHPTARIGASQSKPGWASPAWDRALATVRTTWPDHNGEWRFEATDAVGSIPARYSAENGHHGRRMLVWLSSDGTLVLRQGAWGDDPMTWIYDLHMNLLTGETGKQVAGWSGVIMLLLLLTGLATWWPRGSWRKALAFKRNAAPQRRLRDLHKQAGLWSVLLLLLLVGTGVLLALPDARNAVLERTVAPLEVPPRYKSVLADQSPASVATMLAAAHRALPDAKLVWIEIPGEPDAAIRFRVQVPGDPSSRFPRSYIHVDRYSGTVVGVVDYRRGGSASTINTWLHPLHDASIGGLPARILAVIIGLVPAALFTTGLLHWRRRRKSARPSQSISKTTSSNGV